MGLKPELWQNTKLAKKRTNKDSTVLVCKHDRRQWWLVADAERDPTTTICDDVGGRETWAGPGEMRWGREGEGRAGLDERRHRLVESVEQVLAREQLLDGGVHLRVQLAQVLKARDRLVQ